MKKSKKILFSFASLGVALSLVSVPFIAAACTQAKSDTELNADSAVKQLEEKYNKEKNSLSDEEKAKREQEIQEFKDAIANKNTNAIQQKIDKFKATKPIIFSAPQGKFWPLMTAVAPIIQYYNESHKHDKDFLPVVLKTQEDIKTFSQTELVNQTIRAFDEKDDEQNISSILLGDQIGASILNSKDRLLDMKDAFNVKFDEKIKDVHSELPGEDINDKSKIYSIPFDLSDTDGLIFNLDVMNKLFEIIKGAGGEVSGTIYDKAVAASKTGNSIPERSPFYAIKAKTTNNLNTMKVTDKTFETFKGVKDFVTQVYENTEFDQTKMGKVTKNGRLLSIDYQGDVFLKELVSKTQEQPKLWNLKANDNAVEKSVIDYSNLKNKESAQAKNFVALWDEYKNSIKHQQIKAADSTVSKPINFQSIQFKENGVIDWGGFDLMRFEAAIAFGAVVGDARIKQSPISVAYHLDAFKITDETQRKAEYSLWTKDEDMLVSSSIDKYSPESKQVFWEGGSSLLAVKSDDEEKNKATINFLNFLFNGKTETPDKKMIDNWLFIAETSGYIVPTAAVVTNDKLQELKTRQTELRSKFEAKAKELGENGKNFLVKDSIRDYLATAVYNLESAIVSLESILKFAKGSAHDTNYVGDSKSVKLAGKISNELLELSQLDANNNAKSTKSGKDVLNELQAEEAKEK
ncbi:P68 family surface lipoprotein [Mycoplasma miroungirhinis]|uniref:Lipoprotein n=1 Tax=Mycoplasma miroungirhinis TaxID=754516 RepID=A0A6M4JGG6_9MOLU|nr:hypothetical protein [Mycoplasma miroungirhinis]QJR44132.1 hypothetical protein HLA92_01630 [Mycoplasma miroungirhinis]